MTTVIAKFTKDPDSELDYKWDWKARTNGSEDPEITDWLESGETITSASIVVTAVTSGCLLNVITTSVEDSNTSVVGWLSGGEIYKDFYVTCHIITSSSPIPRRDDRTIKIEVRNR